MLLVLTGAEVVDVIHCGGVQRMRAQDRHRVDNATPKTDSNTLP